MIINMIKIINKEEIKEDRIIIIKVLKIIMTMTMVLIKEDTIIIIKIKIIIIKIMGMAQLKEEGTIIKMIITMETNTIPVIDKTITTNNNISIKAINNMIKIKTINNKTRTIQLSIN